MRRVAPVVGLLLLAAAGPAQADAVTTRIETRPYYGAIVTVEQGVRVWRALPPHDRIIIVPESAKNVKVHIHAGGAQNAPPATFNSSVNINQSSQTSHGDGHGGYGAYGYGAGPHGHGAKPQHSGRSGAFGPARRH
jgi:hypothetical protein